VTMIMSRINWTISCQTDKSQACFSTLDVAAFMDNN
jgi:hypothetical protein